jgi:MFS family permease
MPVYAFAYFTPQIINKGMGYSPGISNLLSAPPFVFSVISAFFFAWVGDKFHTRGPIIAIQCVISIVGLMITAYHTRVGVRYFGMFLGIAGAQGNIPAVLAYQSNNIRMQSKRSVGSALQIGFGAIGGIIASTTFRQKDSPKYLPGLWTTTGLQFFILILLCITSTHFSRRNKEVDNGTAKKPIEGLEGFKYTL